MPISRPIHSRQKAQVVQETSSASRRWKPLSWHGLPCSGTCARRSALRRRLSGAAMMLRIRRPVVNIPDAFLREDISGVPLGIPPSFRGCRSSSFPTSKSWKPLSRIARGRGNLSPLWRRKVVQSRKPTASEKGGIWGPRFVDLFDQFPNRQAKWLHEGTLQ